MKHTGARMECSQERINDLMRAYDEYVESCDYIRLSEVYRAIVDMPSQRFWVSDRRAAVVVSAIMKGEADLDGMLPLKKEMYLEIYHRVIALSKERPGMSVSDLCSIVIEQPAPKFYMTPNSAKTMVCKARKKWIEEKLRRLLRWRPL